MTSRLFLPLALATAAVAVTATAADAATYTVCPRFEIETGDSATAAAYPREDHFLGADGGLVVPAYGIHINVYKNGSSVTGGNVVTSPSTGCHTFTTSHAGPFTMRVYARATDANGNSVRIHNAGPGSLSSYPGSTYSLLTEPFSPTAGFNHFVIVGDQHPRWTMMASAAFTLLRAKDGNYNKSIHIAEDTTEDCFNSSSWSAGGSSSNGFLDEGRGYVRIKSGGACDDDARDMKFLIAHEMGHVLLRLRAGNAEGPQSDEFPYGQLQGAVASCVNDPSYHMNSVEWNGLAFKEGSADFISASVFNNREATGRFIRFGQEIDLEFAPDPYAGGRLVNTCNVASTNSWGLGTRGDWLRFWWDWYTDNSCTSPATRLRVMDVFARTVNDHWNGTNPYADNTAYGAVRTALYAKNYGSCLEAEFRHAACWNGVDRQAGYMNNGCY
ncbi:MAG: hypothetical protein F9K40_11245 [Kofleriaceae bacterium]|nr:MAG: hypothetical protein F9K40_11245 [Kofleriaceae bacterium]MBZ0231084.1 hypothetical protein [Kofleriaceae bacterium]